MGEGDFKWSFAPEGRRMCRARGSLPHQCGVPRAHARGMKRRLFVAIPLSLALREEILVWSRQQKLRALPVRWIAGKNLHLTLVPPWYEDDLAHAKRSLARLHGIVPPFTIVLRKVRYGPEPRHPRLIWAEGDPSPSLRTLKDRAEEVFKVENGRRPWRPHLTLARFRSEDFSRFPFQTLEASVQWEDTVTRIVLMESHLGPGGADYEVLGEATL